MRTWTDKDGDSLILSPDAMGAWAGIVQCEDTFVVFTAPQLRELAAEATSLADQAETPEPKFKMGDAVLHKGEVGIVNRAHLPPDIKPELVEVTYVNRNRQYVDENELTLLVPEPSAPELRIGAIVQGKRQPERVGRIISRHDNDLWDADINGVEGRWHADELEVIA